MSFKSGTYSFRYSCIKNKELIVELSCRICIGSYGELIEELNKYKKFYDSLHEIIGKISYIYETD